MLAQCLQKYYDVVEVDDRKLLLDGEQYNVHDTLKRGERVI